MKDKCLLFYYFTEGAFHVDPSEFMMNDLKQTFHTYLTNHDIKSAKTGEPLKITDGSFLEEAVSLITIPIVIIIDGLDKVNQLKSIKSYEFPSRVIFIKNENILQHFPSVLFRNYSVIIHIS